MGCDGVVVLFLFRRVGVVGIELLVRGSVFLIFLGDGLPRVVCLCV